MQNNKLEYPKLYKTASNGSIQEWQIFVDGNSYWTVHGKLGGKLIVGAKTTCIGKNIGRSNETSPCEQARSEADSKFEKQKSKGTYVENIDDINDESYFKVMLAKSFDTRKGKINYSKCLGNPKLDGIRLVARKEVSHSRFGKPLGGTSYIQERSKQFFIDYPDTILDGELYNHNFKDDFGKLVSLIKRDKDKIPLEKYEDIKQYLQYHIYDVPRFNGMNESTPYIERFNAFWKVIETKYPDLLDIFKKVEYEKINSEAEALSYFKKSVSLGYEGAILRFNLPYEGKRTWNLLKMKEFMDEEFEIVEILEGRGKKEGTAGSMTLKLPNGETFNSNIKGGYDLYDQIWLNRDSLIGKMATCKFFEYSEYGVPRFPYVIKIDRNSYE